MGIRVLHAESPGAAPKVWWNYLEAFARTCPDGWTSSWWNAAHRWGMASALTHCSRRAMAICSIDAIAVDACVANQGLRLMEDDREARAWGSDTQIAIRINGWRYSGPPT